MRVVTWNIVSFEYVFLTLRGFLYTSCCIRMAYAHYPNIIRKHYSLLLGWFLDGMAHNLDKSWNTLKSHDDILNYLNADIICFQGKQKHKNFFF